MARLNRAADFSKLGHYGALWGMEIPCARTEFLFSGTVGRFRARIAPWDVKEPATQNSRGENECLYKYRARCAPR
jgi:hypothetical protein